MQAHWLRFSNSPLEFAWNRV